MISQKKSKNQILNLIVILVVLTTIVNVGVIDLYAFSNGQSNSSKTTNKNSLVSKLSKNSKIKVISTTYSVSKTGNAKSNTRNTNLANSVSSPSSQMAISTNHNSVSNVPNTVISPVSTASQSFSSSAIFSTSTTQPTISISNPINKTYIQNDWVVLNYTVTDTLSYNTAIYLDGTSNSTSWQPGYNITGLTDGLHNLTIESIDSASNVGLKTYLFKVDAVSPVLTISDPVENGYYCLCNDGLGGAGVPVAYTTNITSDQSLIVDLGGTGNFTFPSGTWTPNSDGNYAIIFTLVDSQGYTFNETRYVTYDTTPPALSFNVAPANNSVTNQNSTSITYVASDLSPFSDLIYFNGVNQPSLGVINSTTTLVDSFTWNLGPDGLNNLTIVATDVEGNVANLLLTVIKDTTPPSISITNPVSQSYIPTNFTTLDYSITDKYNFTTVIYRDGNSNKTNWPSGYTFTNLADGQHNITIVSTDFIGNIGILTVLFTVDTIAPVVSITSPNNTTLYSPNVSLTYSITELNGFTTKIYLDGSTNNTNWQSGYTITGLTDGSHNITIVATDAAGNIGNLTVIFNVDAIAPVISITSPVSQSFIPTTYTVLDYTINEANGYSTVIYLNGKTNSTNWQSGYTITSLTTDGTYNITIVSTDQVGNVGTATVIFTVDTTKPVVKIYSPTNTTYGKTSVTMNYTVTDTNLNTTKLFEDGVLVNTTYALSGTVTSVTVGIFSNGPNNVTVIGIDKAGNTFSVTVYFTVDTSLPGLTFINLSNNSYINTNTIAIDYSASNYNLMYVYNDSLTYNTTNSYNSGFLLVNLADGFHNVTIRLVRSLTGNTITESLLFTVDTINPSVSLYTPPNGVPETSSPLTLSYVVSDTNLKNVTIYQNGVANTTTEDPGFQLKLPDGNYNITVVAYDYAGNTNSSTSLFYVDTTPPVIQIYTPVNNSGYPGAFYFIYNVTDLHLNYINVYEDGVNDGRVANDSILSFGSGNHNITIYAVDTTGHYSIQQVLFYIDTTLPSVTISSPTSNGGYGTSSITLTYTATDADLNTVVIYKDGVANITALPSGTTLNFADGNHNISILAIDSAGNEYEATVLFYTETTGPIITITSPTNTGYNAIPVILTYNINESHLNSANTYIYIDGIANPILAYPSGTQLPYSDGTYNITIYAINNQGYSSVATVIFYVDTALPNLSLVNPTNTTYNSKSLTFQYAVTDNDLSSVIFFINGQANTTTFASGNTLSFPNGYYNLTLYAIDAVGNSISFSVYFTVNVSATITSTTSTTTSSHSATTPPSSNNQGSSSTITTTKKGGSSPGFEVFGVLLVMFLVVPFYIRKRRQNLK